MREEIEQNHQPMHSIDRLTARTLPFECRASLSAASAGHWPAWEAKRQSLLRQNRGVSSLEIGKHRHPGL